MDLTKEAKRVMKYSASEAARCEDRVIRPEHLLLGMMREEGCVAERMLTERGGNLERMRNRMTEL
jgi:ATP-dependent Clp protease ATP-binding subunit ClpA